MLTFWRTTGKQICSFPIHHLSSVQSHVSIFALASSLKKERFYFLPLPGKAGHLIGYSSSSPIYNTCDIMPKRRNKNSNHPKKIQKFAHEDQFHGVEYHIENGLRKVKPYVYKFECHAKGRWFGSKLLDVFKKEFRLETAEYYETAIREGLIRVNRGAASPDRVLKNNDFMQSKVHRHEPPVSGQPIQILAETEEYLVINKPASIPVHPCGKYRHNTIVFILGREYGYKGLHTIHRLDRLTSGILLFARTLEVSHRLDAYVRDRKLEKTYLCKVKGQFPSEPIECSEPIFIVSHKIGVCRVKPDGKQCHTRFERLSYDGETSIVKCYPLTGRMHQIRVHLQYLGYPIMNDPLYNNPVWGTKKGEGGYQGHSDEQLLKDLIDQHDVEIDSALEKARIQTLLNAKKSGSTVAANDEITRDTSVGTETDNSIVEHNGSSNCAGMMRTSDMGDGCSDSPGQSSTAQDSNSISEFSGSLHSRTSTDDSTESPLESATRNSSQSQTIPDRTMSDQAGVTEDVAVAREDVTVAKEDVTLAKEDVTDAKEDVTVAKEDVAVAKEDVTVAKEDVTVAKEIVTVIKEDVAVAKKDVTVAKEDATVAREGVAVAEDDSSVDERLEDEKTDKLAKSLCRECKAPMPDPEPDQMCIYLHALTYKGPGFEFSAPPPEWATEHFKRTGIEYT